MTDIGIITLVVAASLMASAFIMTICDSLDEEVCDRMQIILVEKCMNYIESMLVDRHIVKLNERVTRLTFNRYRIVLELGFSDHNHHYDKVTAVFTAEDKREYGIVIELADKCLDDYLLISD